MKETGDPLAYLHWDHLGGVVLTTVGSSANSSQRYDAFGAKRGGGTLPTDHRFTGQKLDESGLYYINARYYDPAIGQFVSPDTVVADPASLFDYDRYMYARGNPLRFSDPTGNYSDEVLFAHFNCQDWACVERYFQDGGDYAVASGHFARIDGKIGHGSENEPTKKKHLYN